MHWMWNFRNFEKQFKWTLCDKCINVDFHTSAKLIEIQRKFLQGRHGLHELGGQMESNDALHGSELVPHWVLGPKNSKFGQKILLKNFFTQS